MGTRGIYGFRKGGKEKITYNHYDSYPDYLGANVVEFIKKHTVKQLEKIYDNIILIDENSRPTIEQIAECKRFENLSVSNQNEDDWYCLLRETQGNLDLYDEGLRYMIDSSSFIHNSLWCEYGYIINLDNDVLEFYIGFQNTPTESNIYGCEKDEDGYYPCKCILQIPLEDIRKTRTSVKDVVAILNKAEKNERDSYGKN